MGFFTGIGMVVVAGLVFMVGMYLYVELSEMYLIRYCRKQLVVNKRCFNCGETSSNRLVTLHKYGKPSNEWVCFDRCDNT